MNIPLILGLIVACVILLSVGYYSGRSSAGVLSVDCGRPSCPSCPKSLSYKDMMATIPSSGGGALAARQDSRASDLLKVYVAPSGSGTVEDVYKFLYWAAEAYPLIDHMRLEIGGGEGGATGYMKKGTVSPYDMGRDVYLYTPTRKVQSL